MIRCFNPRTREGCDCLGPAWIAGLESFQSTHPRGVRQKTDMLRSMPRTSFNPRTREGCDCKVIYRPALDEMFQSTHPRGVRPPNNRIFGRSGQFQSTHPRGVRHFPGWPVHHGFNVSIHAPARGATVFLCTYRIIDGSFNPRTREGCDMIGAISLTSWDGFNPRTREGCDSLISPMPSPSSSFNPRTREGCDGQDYI